MKNAIGNYNSKTMENPKPTKLLVCIKIRLSVK